MVRFTKQEQESLKQSEKDTYYLGMLDLLERIKKFDHLRPDSVLRPVLEATAFHARQFIDKEINS